MSPCVSILPTGSHNLRHSQSVGACHITNSIYDFLRSEVVSAMDNYQKIEKIGEGLCFYPLFTSVVSDEKKII